MIKNKTDYLYYLGLILFTCGVGYLSLGQGFDFDAYAGFNGDGTFGMTLVKSIQENGFSGIWFNGRLGAPGTSVLLDYPVLGNMMVLILWVLSWFISNTPRIMYTYLILTFALDGLSMFLLLRKIKINREISFVVSSLFAFAPYHFYRYLGHSSLINYMFVPIAIYLALHILGILEGEKKWKIAVAAVLLGLGYGYYYAFGLILLAVAYLIKFIKLEHKKEITKHLWVVVVLLGTILVSFMPKLIYTLGNGSNTEAGQRIFYEQEIYGLKIVNLLLPASYTRIKPLGSLTQRYLASGAPLNTENRMASLGLIASIGFMVLCLALIVSLVRKGKCEGKEWELVDFLSLATLTFVLTASIGGFGEIFNMVVTPQIRCYNRSSIFIMGLSLIMVALLLNKIACRKEVLSIVVCVVVLGVGCYDQVRIYKANWQDSYRAEQEMYEAYFAEVEEHLEEGAMVYQLPYFVFPEAGAINEIPDYKHFVGYLYTDRLRWSYGAVRGRDSATRKLHVDEGMSYEFLSGIKAAGFQAVYIDLAGYDDWGGAYPGLL